MFVDLFEEIPIQSARFGILRISPCLIYRSFPGLKGQPCPLQVNLFYGKELAILVALRGFSAMFGFSVLLTYF